MVSNNLKIIFSGPVGAGKTTAIQTLSDTPPISTNESASDMTKKRKRETTVAMDYGTMNLDGNEKIHLYGTPGQERFNFMWDILTSGGLGLVMLIDNTRKDPIKDLLFFINSFKDYIDKTALSIGITRTDLRSYPRISNYHQALKDININVPVFQVDAREYSDVAMLVQALLFSIDPGVGTDNE
ncbi:GTP-binding protein [Gammaproteobacteria bacterium 50_400_T64]|nr:GTP-binding protein [Gammaproteobacteria bacterium 50_400_T64]